MPAAATAAGTFFVAYSGSGWDQTVYHGQEPNLGGKPDHDYADDTETQRWLVRFTAPLVSTGCAGAPCLLTGGTGTTRVTATIDHVHHDGLYRQFDRTVRCRLRSSTGSGQNAGAALAYRWLDRGQALALTALNPVAAALLTLPSACPSQGGDSIDGLADNYLGPGYSEGAGWGAERWFTSRTVVVAVSRLRRAGRVRVALGLTKTGTPPAHCATTYPWQQCTTGGSWAGVLTLSEPSTSAAR